MVAKSYQSLERIGDVFTASGKSYVNVKLKSGKVKSVRWYTDAEYAKLYPAVSAVSQPSNTGHKPQKEILGFTKGYITIFAGVNDLNDHWFRACPVARYHDWWGWYVISTEAVPEVLPDGVRAIELPWDAVGANEHTLKAKPDVKQAVDTYLYEEDGGQFIGEVGERIDFIATVMRAIPLENNFGHSTMHIFTDTEGNEYIWTTSAKTLVEGATYSLRGTVKEHRIYQGRHQNILTRCFINREELK